MSKIQDRKIAYSRWSIFLLLLIIITAGSISVLFQAPTITSQDFDRYIYLFDRKFFNQITKIAIKNSLVDFTLELSDQGNWSMTNPRTLPVSSEAVASFFKTLQDVKIKRTLTYEPINLTSYNLNSPTSEVILSLGHNETTSIRIGLVNPIDDSCYISVEDRDAIYQANNFASRIESIDLTTFVDSRVFNEEATTLAIQVNRRTRKFTLDNDEWKENNQDVKESAKTYLEELLLLQCQTILDIFGPAAKTVIDQYLKNPPIAITLDNNDEKKVLISNAINQIPGIKIERNQNVLAKLANGQLCLINKKRTQFILDNFRNI